MKERPLALPESESMSGKENESESEGRITCIVILCWTLMMTASLKKDRLKYTLKFNIIERIMSLDLPSFMSTVEVFY